MLGVVHLKDIVKGGIKERFARFRAMGIRTVMITGDNPRTAAAIAAEAGVDDFLAEATPETKMRAHPRRAGQGQARGHDRRRHQRRAGAGPGRRRRGDEHRHAGRARRPATWSTSTRNPTKLLEVVEVGKQLLMTRGCLTTFSIANDVAKYFAILPGDVHGRLPGDRTAQRHAAGLAAERHPLGGDLQRAHHRAADPARAARRPATARSARPRCCAARCSSTASAASSLPSSASSSSTCCSPLVGLA